jgi:hypothetical protein
MNPGDYIVFGLVPPSHLIVDIAMDVPYGREIVIPADKANGSKDLHRAINQKKIFRLPDQPVPRHLPPLGHIRDDILQERNSFLEVRCKQLEAENRELQETSRQLQETLRLTAEQQNQTGLDTILKAIQAIKAGAVYVNGTSSAPKDDVADGTAPQFIPNEITPKDAETRIGVQRSTGDSGVSTAADRLRKMRQGGG